MTSILQDGYVGILLFLNIHLTCIILGQLFFVLWYRRKWHHINKRRQTLGLTSKPIIHQSRQLAERRKEVLIESAILLFTIFIVPLILILISQVVNVSSITESTNSLSTPTTVTTSNSQVAPSTQTSLTVSAPNVSPTFPNANRKIRRGITLAFLGLLLWILISGTSSAKAVLGGLTFKWLSVFTRPFQIGDRVTLKGHNGKVIEIGTFFVKLQTLNDNLISIPTYTLWGEQLNSSNAGSRSSLCEMDFYLAPWVTAQQRQAAEDAIWNAIQASAYYDPTSPLQIYLTQTPESIQLTAKAYVASTYNEPLFTSDVTRAFLDFTAQADITLASRTWPPPSLAIARPAP